MDSPPHSSFVYIIVYINLPHWPTESFFCMNCYTTDNRQWTWDCKFLWNSANVTSSCKTTELNLFTSGLNLRICQVKPFWNKLIPSKTQKIERGKRVFYCITKLLAMRKLLEGLALIYLCVRHSKLFSAVHMTASRERLTDA